jgi:beta-lactamase class A
MKSDDKMENRRVKLVNRSKKVARLWAVAFTLTVALLNQFANAQESKPQSGSARRTTQARSLGELRKELNAIANTFNGKLGYSFHHLKTDERLERRGDEQFPTASTIKLAMLCAALELQQQAKVGYYDRLALEKGDIEGGTGFMKYYREGVKPTFKEVLHLMITSSDNVATNIVGRRIGMEAVNNWLDRHGFKATRLLVPWPDVKAGLEKDNELRKQVEKWGMGVSTPNEMARLLEMINDNRAGTPAACEEMQRILNHQYFDEGIASQIPPSVAVANKTGIMKYSRSDIALVHSPSGDYVLTVYTNDGKDTSVSWNNEHAQAIRAISRAVWQHYHPDSRWSPPVGSEKFSEGPDW